MKHYAGLDVSLKEISICVVDGDGKTVAQGACPADPEGVALLPPAICFNFKRLWSVNTFSVPMPATLFLGVEPDFIMGTGKPHARSRQGA